MNPIRWLWIFIFTVVVVLTVGGLVELILKTSVCGGSF